MVLCERFRNWQGMGVQQEMKKILIIMLLALLLSGCGLQKAAKVLTADSEAEDKTAEAEAKLEESKKELERLKEEMDGSLGDALKEDSDGATSPGTPEEQFEHFVDVDMAEVGELEMDIQNSILQASEQPEQELIEVLDQAIIDYDEVIERVEAIKVDSEELQKAKEGALEGVNLYKESLVLYRETFNDPGKEAEMNAKGDEFEKSAAAFHDNLNELAAKYGYTYTQP